MSPRFLPGLGAWLLGAVTATTGSMIAVNELAHGLLDAQAQQVGGTTISVDHDHDLSGADPSPAPTAAPSVRATKPVARARQSGRVGAPAAKVMPSSPPQPDTSASKPPAQGSAGTLLVSADGSVMATCEPAGAYLLYWSPDQGFEADDVLRGPAAVASVLFQGSTSSLVMRVSCSGGTPVAHVYGGRDE